MTYGRFPSHGHLLAEMLESFVRQDYQGPMELLLLNDAPEQKLICNHSNVRVINLPKRVGTLGAKRNIAVTMAKYSLLVPFDDDDVSLRARVQQGVEMLGTYDWWRPPQTLYYHKGHSILWDHSIGVRHNSCIFRRSAWEKVGGYPNLSCGEDMAINTLFHRHCSTAPEGIPHPRDWQYIYRWNVSPTHISGYGGNDPEKGYNAIGERPVVAGSWEIVPGFLEDYDALVKAALPP